MLAVTACDLPEHFSQSASQLAQSASYQHPGWSRALRVGHSPPPLDTHRRHSLLLLSRCAPQRLLQNARHLGAYSKKLCTNNGLFRRITKSFTTRSTPTHTPMHAYAPPPEAANWKNNRGGTEHNRNVYHMTPRAWRRRRGGRCWPYFCWHVSLPRRQRRRGLFPW